MTTTTGATGATGTTRTFEKSIDNRKHLVERIAAISGQKMVYTRAPRYAYQIGVFSVERDGKLVITNKSADESVGRVIAVLKAEGLIGEEIIIPEEVQAEQTEVNESTGTNQAETASELPNQPAMETAEASTVMGAIMESITDETAEQPQGASEEASEEADAEEPDTESINTPEINIAEDESCHENCLLGTEDWDDEENSSDEAQIEQAEQQMPVIQLQEFSGLPELPAEGIAEGTEDASENDSMIDYGQAVPQMTEAQIDAEGTARTAISGAASELSNQQGMEASELTEETAGAVTAVTQAATLETSEECQPIHEAPAPSPEPASTSITNYADNVAGSDDVPNSAADNNDDFSFPLADHTTRSMLNLINMIYTRGSLLSKATGGKFGVDKDLITILADDDEYESKEFLVDFIREHVEEGARLDGISFTNSHVTFTGFPAMTDTTGRAGTAITPDKVEVFKRLAARMNKMAQEQKRIVPKEITEPNEKYAFRVWLIRLGMNGDDCKVDRKVLLENLSGHTAFRTEADKEKWIARQNAKKRKMHVAFERETTATEPAVTSIEPAAVGNVTSAETVNPVIADETDETKAEPMTAEPMAQAM